MNAAALVPGALGSSLVASERDAFWEHCRNNLGIARLLVYEGRAEPLAATAALMAVECACRSALAQAGLRFDGDLGFALSRLAAPAELAELVPSADATERLVWAERAVEWVAAYLRSEAPERSWGF